MFQQDNELKTHIQTGFRRPLLNLLNGISKTLTTSLLKRYTLWLNGTKPTIYWLDLNELYQLCLKEWWSNIKPEFIHDLVCSNQNMLWLRCNFLTDIYPNITRSVKTYTLKNCSCVLYNHSIPKIMASINPKGKKLLWHSYMMGGCELWTGLYLLHEATYHPFNVKWK